MTGREWTDSSLVSGPEHSEHSTARSRGPSGTAFTGQPQGFAAGRGSTPNILEGSARNVVLNIEYMSDTTTRVLLAQFRLFLLFALGLLLWETVTKFAYSNAALVLSDSLVIVNTVVASTCLVVMLGIGTLLLKRIRRVNRAGNVWGPRRMRAVALISAELAIQIINLVFYLAPNANVLAQPCSWFLKPIYAFSIVRWTCWNALFCLFVVQAQNPLPAQYTGLALLKAAIVRPAQRAGVFVLQAVRQGLLRLSAVASTCCQCFDPQAAAAVSGHEASWQQQQSRAAAPEQEETAAATAAVAPPVMLAPLQEAAEAGGGAKLPAGEEDEEETKEEGEKPALAAGPGPAALGPVIEISDGAGPGVERMVGDLPLRSHLLKAVILWLPCQLVLIAFLIYSITTESSRGGPCSSQDKDEGDCYPLDNTGTMAADCRKWRRYQCDSSSVTMALTSLTSALLSITLLTYFVVLYLARQELAKRPYCTYRTHNILLRLQCQTRLIAAVFFVMCNTLFWYIGERSCTSYMETWLGLTPMEIVMTSLVLLNVICILPNDPTRKELELHTWRQDFAWLETDLPRKLAQRPLAASEPMFCVETALKMMCWSWLAYEDDVEDGEEGEWQETKGKQGQVVGEEWEKREPEEKSQSRMLAGAESTMSGTCSTGRGVGSGPENGGSSNGHVRHGRDSTGRLPSGGSRGCKGGRGQLGNQGKGAAAVPAAALAVPAAAPAARVEKADDLGGGAGGLSLETALGLYGLTQHRVLWGPEHDAKCVIGWGQGGTIVCSFRGTVSLKNMLSNIKVWRAAHPPVRGSYWLCRQPMVHWGFLNTWQANGLNAQVLEALRDLLTSGSPPPHGRPWRLLFTGHSLGGALASLAAYDAVTLCRQLAQQLPGGRADITVYTFGAPRPGNHAFAWDYITRVPASFDVIHSDDAVVRNGKFVMLYKRAAHRVVLTPTGDLIVRPSLMERSARESFGSSIQQHMLGAYGLSFAALIRGQLQRQKEHNQGRRGCQALLQSEYVRQVLRVTAGFGQDTFARFRLAPNDPNHPDGDADTHLASGAPLPSRQPSRMPSSQPSRQSTAPGCLSLAGVLSLSHSATPSPQASGPLPPQATGPFHGDTHRQQDGMQRVHMALGQGCSSPASPSQRHGLVEHQVATAEPGDVAV